MIDLTINTITSSKIARKAIEKVGGIHSHATLPKFDSNTLKKRYKKLDEFNPKETQTDRTTGKVMIFGTCYCNYNTPDIGEDLINVLRFNDIKTELIEKEKCCGMPKLELGDLDSVEEAKKYNIPKLVKAIKDGYDIIAPIPSCVLMYKQELPLMFPEDDDVLLVKSRIFDPFEYLSLREKEGLFNKNFKNQFDKISYQAACHQRVQNIGPKTKEILAMIPGASVDVIERCSGHDGTYAVKVESHEKSIKIRRPVVSKAKRFEPQVFTSDCPMASQHIGEALDPKTDINLHPITILKKAYGI